MNADVLIKKLHTYAENYIMNGTAVFSRCPIVNKGMLPFDASYSSSCIYFDIVKGADTVRIYNVHMESYQLDEEDRRFVKEITKGNADNITENVKDIGSRMIKANKRRAKQALQISVHLQSSPYKVILCGDFNDTPLSYTYHMLKRGLKDSFIEAGRGLGNTYIGEFPSFRIDYVLHSPSFRTVGYARDQVVWSDHYPVAAKLVVK